MNISESFMTALDSIVANKLRSILTMLGVIIGVAAVIALLSIGNGVNASITDEINSVGTNLINISPDKENSGGYPPLSMSDAEALANPLNVPALSNVAAMVQGSQEVVYNGAAFGTSVIGVTPNYFAVNNLDDFQAGDGIVQNDLDNRERVAVVGVDVVTELFGEEYPVGRSVKINGVDYEIVGVLESQSGSIGGNPDENVYVPLTTAQSRLYPDRTRTGELAVSSISAQAVNEQQAPAAVDQITEVLRGQHDIAVGDEDDFSIFSQTDLLDTVNEITGIMTAFLGAIAAISLLVGGIGIMNIMLVSVTERTREIGIRKAVGALKRDIMAQFLLESMVVSLLGGFLGIVLGILLATGAANVLNLSTIISPDTVILATGFAAGVGLVFGIYPAWRAASLRPIEALRYE
ncbi:MAG: ABC transporter permease [Chloroflexota bacterium]|nr:ABC transporter permease [Chloroflexota bacterium]